MFDAFTIFHVSIYDIYVTLYFLKLNQNAIKVDLSVEFYYSITFCVIIYILWKIIFSYKIQTNQIIIFIYLNEFCSMQNKNIYFTFIS